MDGEIAQAKRRVHLKIKGQVQRVFFRSNIRSWASMLGVTGWVKNTEDYVEAILEGDQEQIQELIHFCREGPKGSIVDDVEVEEQKYRGEYINFEIKY